MVKRLVDYTDPETRRSFLGGSDAAGVLGLSRWTTPLQVWAEKTGQVEREDISGKLNVKLGTRLEEAVAELFCEATGFKVRRVNETIFHEEHEFLAANIDRRVVGDDSILECKTTSAWNAKAWEGEEIPQEYIIQCLHYLAVTGMRKAYIAVLIGNQDFKWKEIDRDEKTIASIVEQEVKFWNEFVIPKVMPTRIMASDSETLLSLFPEAQPQTVLPLTDDILKVIENRNSMIADSKSLEAHIDQAENEIKAFLGENEAAESQTFFVSWKNQSQQRVDSKLLKEKFPEIAAKVSKETKFRKLSVKTKKESE